MIEYYGTKFLDELYDYYRSRYLQAKEHGYDEEKSRYYWLFKELRERLLMLLQVARFLEELPRFMSSSMDEQAIQYVTIYTSDFFKPELVGELERDQAGVHPFFNEANPYWTQMNEVLDGTIPIIFRSSMWISANTQSALYGCISKFGRCRSEQLTARNLMRS